MYDADVSKKKRLFDAPLLSTLRDKMFFVPQCPCSRNIRPQTRVSIVALSVKAGHQGALF